MKLSAQKLLLSIIVFIHTLFIPLFLQAHLSILNYFLLIILILSNIAFLRLIFKKSDFDHEDTLNRIDFLAMSILFVSSVTICYFEINKFPIWLDEYMEGYHVLKYADFVLTSAGTQQPPLDYYWRSIGLSIKGINESGLRLASACSFVLLIQTFYLIIKKISKNYLYSFFSAFIIGFQQILIVYAVEARAYCISLFYGALTLFFFFDFINLKRSTSLTKDHYLIFFVFFWLMSLSMQPLFAIVILFVFSVWKAFFKKNKKFSTLSVSLLLAMVLFLPFAFSIYQNSTKYLIVTENIYEKNGFFSLLSFALKSLFAFNTYSLVLSLQTASILAISSFLLKNKKVVLYPLGFGIIYFLSLILFFHLKINWFFAYRYVLTTVPIFFFIFFLGTWLVFDSKYQFAKIFYLAILSAFSIFAFFQDGVPREQRLDWKSLYSALDRDSQQGSRAFLLSFQESGHMIEDQFIAPEFYISDKIKFKTIYDFSYPVTTTNDYIYKSLSLEKKAQFFFVVTTNTLNAEILDKLESKDIKKISTGDFTIFKNERPLRLLDMAKNFFSILNVEIPQPHVQVKALDLLFLISLFEKNCKAADNYLKEWTPIAINFDRWLELRAENHKRVYNEICGLPK